MCEIIESEIDKITEKGLTTSNVEMAYKLIDMYKDLKTVEGMEAYEGDSSYGYRKRDSMGRYIRNGYSNEGYSREGGYSNEAYDPYMKYSQAKYDYRHSRSNGSKQAIMNSLDDYMNDITGKLTDMMRDADTQDERETIKRYISKIKAM